jgi:ATP-dependent RNA helicase DDX10/DBP4
MLMPQEEQPVLQALQTATIPIKKLTVNPNRKFSVSSQAAALLAAQPEYRMFAKKAFTSYLRSLQMLPNYPISDVSQLPVNEFATSLGLPFTPELPMLTQQGESAALARDENREKKNVNRALDKLRKQIKEAKELKKRAKEEAKRTGRNVEEILAEMKGRAVGEETDSDEENDKSKKRSKKLSEIALEIAQKNSESKKDGNGQDEEDDDFLTVKRVHHWNEGDNEANAPEAMSEDDDAKPVVAQKVKPMVVKIKKDGSIKVKNAPAPKKTVFDDEGNTVDNTLELQDGSKTQLSQELVNRRISEYADQVKSIVDQGRSADEAREKQRLREAKLKRKQAERDAKRQEMGIDGDDAGAPVLASAIEEEEDEGNYDDSASDDSDDEDDNSNSGSEYSSSVADGDSGDDDDDDSYDADHAAKFKSSANNSNKRKRNIDDSEDEDEDDSDSDSDSSEDERQAKRKKKVDPKKLAEQERLALQLLNR